LSEDDCWTIFSERAFNGNGVNSRLTEIGKQIVKRCEGIPSVAHYLGSVVHSKGEDAWLLARDEEIWKLGKMIPTEVDLFSSLKQTYNNMSSVLKSCLMYLSVLPKASCIAKEKLVRQLVALDMIGSNHRTLSDYVLGEMCIQELLSISFLEVTGISSESYKFAKTKHFLSSLFNSIICLHTQPVFLITLESSTSLMFFGLK
jgi:hypothetical protein